MPLPPAFHAARAHPRRPEFEPKPPGRGGSLELTKMTSAPSARCGPSASAVSIAPLKLTAVDSAKPWGLHALCSTPGRRAGAGGGGVADGGVVCGGGAARLPTAREVRGERSGLRRAARAAPCLDALLVLAGCLSPPVGVPVPPGTSRRPCMARRLCSHGQWNRARPGLGGRGPGVDRRSPPPSPALTIRRSMDRSKRAATAEARRARLAASEASSSKASTFAGGGGPLRSVP